MEIHVSDLTWNQFIYPSSPTFNKGGKGRFLDETTDLPAGRHEATIILDGIHRRFAFKEVESKRLRPLNGRTTPPDYEKNKVALLLESAECNIIHGDRLSHSDKKRIARDIASTDPACPPTARSCLAHEVTPLSRYRSDQRHYKRPFGEKGRIAKIPKC